MSEAEDQEIASEQSKMDGIVTTLLEVDEDWLYRHLKRVHKTKKRRKRRKKRPAYEDEEDEEDDEDEDDEDY